MRVFQTTVLDRILRSQETSWEFLHSASELRPSQLAPKAQVSSQLHTWTLCEHVGTAFSATSSEKLRSNLDLDHSHQNLSSLSMEQTAAGSPHIRQIRHMTGKLHAPGARKPYTNWGPGSGWQDQAQEKGDVQDHMRVNFIMLI